MSLALSVIHELTITRAQLEMKAWRSDDESARDEVELTLDVKSSRFNDDKRKVTGEVHLHSSPGSLASSSEMSGTWIFYTQDRFHADVEVPEAFLMRIWNCYSSRPQWILLNFWEAPEASVVGQNYEGKFCIHCRAGSERGDLED
jgi:hypothetical protein